MKNTYKETDLYNPIRQMLTDRGFTVRGEVKGCDIAAVKDDILWVVEMKLVANLTLIYQAMERQAATGWVFVAMPRPKSSNDKSYKKLQRLLKKLKLGLITVALDSPLKYAEVVIFPEGKDNKDTKKANQLKKEIEGRSFDTVGGATKAKINTAYRERCVCIACLLEEKGPLRPSELVKNYGCHKDAGFILRANYFGWYNKVSRGTYELSEKGREYLAENESSGLVVYYKMKAKT